MERSHEQTWAMKYHYGVTHSVGFQVQRFGIADPLHIPGSHRNIFFGITIPISSPDLFVQPALSHEAPFSRRTGMSFRRPTDPLAARHAEKEEFTAPDLELRAALPKPPLRWGRKEQDELAPAGMSQPTTRRVADMWDPEGRQSGGSTSTKPMGASIGTARGFRWRQVA